jgi:hypothetical protein
MAALYGASFYGMPHGKGPQVGNVPWRSTSMGSRGTCRQYGRNGHYRRGPSGTCGGGMWDGSRSLFSISVCGKTRWTNRHSSRISYPAALDRTERSTMRVESALVPQITNSLFLAGVGLGALVCCICFRLEPETLRVARAVIALSLPTRKMFQFRLCVARNSRPGVERHGAQSWQPTPEFSRFRVVSSTAQTAAARHSIDAPRG